jgi:hypothetical protein
VIGALLLAAAVGAPPVSAPTLSARLTPTEVTVGDRVQVELELALPPGTEPPSPTHLPALPAGLRRWGEAEVLSASPAQPLPGSERAPRFLFHLVLAAFRPGEVTLPPIPVSLPAAPRDDGRPGEPTLLLRTPEGLGFSVRSVLPAGQPTPQPPAPPRPLPVGAAFWWTAGALGLAALLASAGLLLRRRALGFEPAAAAPALPPLVALRRELGVLRAETSAERLHTGLSLALRRFLAALIGYPAAERTTSEIDRQLRSERLAVDTRRGLVELLRRCDEVKFARRVATPEEGRQRLDAAERLAAGADAELRPPAAPGAENAA